MADVVAEKRFDGWVGFLKRGCAIEEIWITGREEGFASCISHVSHRGLEKGCEKVGTYVAKVSKCAFIRGLEGTVDSQFRGFHSFHMGGVCGG